MMHTKSNQAKNYYCCFSEKLLLNIRILIPSVQTWKPVNSVFLSTLLFKCLVLQGNMVLFYKYFLTMLYIIILPITVLFCINVYFIFKSSCMLVIGDNMKILCCKYCSIFGFYMASFSNKDIFTTRPVELNKSMQTCIHMYNKTFSVT